MKIPIKEFLFPVTRNNRVSHHLWTYRNTTRVSVDCSQITQGLFVIQAVFVSCLAAAFMNQMNPLIVRKFSCSILCRRLQQHRSHGIPMTRSIFFSFVLIVMILDTCVDRYPPREGLAPIVIHFLSPVGMTVFLNEESLRRLLRWFAQISLLPSGAWISSVRLDSPSSIQGSFPSDFWKAVRNSSLDLISFLWSWISCTKRSVSLEIKT